MAAERPMQDLVSEYADKMSTIFERVIEYSDVAEQSGDLEIRRLVMARMSGLLEATLILAGDKRQLSPVSSVLDDMKSSVNPRGRIPEAGQPRQEGAK